MFFFLNIDIKYIHLHLLHLILEKINSLEYKKGHHYCPSKLEWHYALTIKNRIPFGLGKRTNKQC